MIELNDNEARMVEFALNFEAKPFPFPTANLLLLLIAKLYRALVGDLR